MTDTAVVEWGPDLVGLRMQDLLEDAELGDRVTWELLMEQCAGRYTKAEDREWSMSLLLYGRLAHGGVALDDPRMVAFQEHAKELDRLRAGLS